MAERNKLITPPFVARFPALFTARLADNKDPNSKKLYSVAAIWTPDSFREQDKERWKALIAALDAECQRIFKMSWKECKRSVEDGGVNDFKPGVHSGLVKKDVEGFGAGTFYSNLSTQFQPGIATTAGNAISEEEGNTDLIYDGCLCRASVSPYAYNGKGKGVSLGLNNIQLISANKTRYPVLQSRGNAAADFADADLDSSWMDQDELSLDDDIPF